MRPIDIAWTFLKADFDDPEVRRRMNDMPDSIKHWQQQGMFADQESEDEALAEATERTLSDVALQRTLSDHADSRPAARVGRPLREFRHDPFDYNAAENWKNFGRQNAPPPLPPNPGNYNLVQYR